ncbi:MAG: multidrug efflux SMR transporter [Peptococcaceae bacterium]|nr:multidrug efflux SMR transporter [Peptococcaceae bacterium]
MPYIMLGAAIALEIMATTLLKASVGFTKLLPSIGSVSLYIICFFIFSKALNSINLGVAYATWCAGGIVATALISAVIFGQRVNGVGIFALVLIVVGCVVLNLFGSAQG